MTSTLNQSEELFREVNSDVIQALKAAGYKSVELVLREPDDHKAKVEVVPGMRTEFHLDFMLLTDPEIELYFGRPSPMAKYVIDVDCLK